MATVRKYSAATYARLAQEASARVDTARHERRDRAMAYAYARFASIKIDTARRIMSADAIKPVGACTIDGEPLKASHQVSPVADSVRKCADHDKGTCPLCGTPARLSQKGFLTAHKVRNEPLGVAPGLSERSIEPTDTGARVGDPDSGSKRRASEIDGAYGRGTVEIKIKNDAGKTEKQEVPATAEALRVAADQSRKAADRKRAASDRARSDRAQALADGNQQLAFVADGKALGTADAASKLDAESRRLLRQAQAAETGMARYESPVAADGNVFPTQRGTERLDGPALAGSNLPPVQPQRGYLATAGTMSLPTGRIMPDRGALGEAVTPHTPEKVKACADSQCQHIAGGTAGYLTYAQLSALSKTRQRRYWSHVKTNQGRIKRAAEYAARRPNVQRDVKRTNGRAGTFSDGRDAIATERLMSQRPDGRESREYV